MVSLTCTARRGKGSAFKFFLPVSQEKEEKGQAKDMINKLPLGKKTVLIVDDDALVRRLVVDILKPLGYTVIEASSGKEAITIINSFHGNIDILLTDIIMPEMNGRQLADVFLSQRPGKKVIFMSGYTDEALGHNHMLDEGIIFIEKPIILRNSPEAKGSFRCLIQKMRANHCLLPNGTYFAEKLCLFIYIFPKITNTDFSILRSVQ